MSEEIFVDSPNSTKYNVMSDSNTIIIISDKTVSLNENIGKIVAGESNAQMLTFEIERYYDGVDLSDKIIKIIYKNSTVSNSVDAVNICYSSTHVRFSWVLDYAVTVNKGAVVASIQFIGKDEFNNDYSLKTTNFKLIIEGSLDGAMVSIDTPTDWFTNINNRLKAIEDNGGVVGEINYNTITNKPQINGVTLNGNKTSNELGLQPNGDYATNDQLNSAINKVNNTIDNLEIPSIDGLVNESYVNNAISNLVIPSIEGLATTSYVDNGLLQKANTNHTHSELHTHSNKTVLDEITSEKINSWNNKSDFSGSYNDLTDKPTIPSIDGLASETYVDTAIANAQISGGGTDVDLSGYATTSYVDNAISNIDLGECNVQADWNETDITSDAYINNKPTELPASDVSEWAKQLTKPTYTASEVGALSDDTQIPSKTSDLTNDSNFATETYVNTAISNASINGSGENNVQADWNETDNTSDAYILNKPITTEIISSNIFDSSTATSGYDRNGEFRASDSYYHSVPIYVNEGDVLIGLYSSGLASYIAQIYLTDGTSVNINTLADYTHTDDLGKWTATMPVNASYIVANVPYARLGQYMLVKNMAYPTMYVPYEERTTLDNIYGYNSYNKNEIDTKVNAQYYSFDSTSNLFYIYMNNFRYTFKKCTNSTINQDTWRLYQGDFLDKYGIICANLWTNSDAEGVLKINGESDFVGGYHGDEIMSSINVIADGVVLSLLSDISKRQFNNLTFVVDSSIYHCTDNVTTNSIVFNRIKQLIFSNDKLTIRNRWKCVEDVNLISGRTTMFNCYKSYNDTQFFTNYSVNSELDLFDVPTGTDEGTLPTASKNMTQATLYTTFGSIGVKIVKGSEMPSYLGCLENFASQNRMKVYFDTIKELTSYSVDDIIATEFEIEMGKVDSSIQDISKFASKDYVDDSIADNQISTVSTTDRTLTCNANTIYNLGTLSSTDELDLTFPTDGICYVTFVAGDTNQAISLNSSDTSINIEYKGVYEFEVGTTYEICVMNNVAIVG